MRRPGMLQTLRKLARCRRATAALEFAFVGPVMLMILIGMFVAGVAINNYMILTNAAQQGAQSLALSRGTSTPYTTATAAINSAAPTLTTASIVKTFNICTNAATPDCTYQCTKTACSVTTAGYTAKVTITYPCSLMIYSVNYAGGTCTLSASAANVVQ